MKIQTQDDCYVDFSTFDRDGRILITNCYERNKVYKCIDFNDCIQLRDYLTTEINKHNKISGEKMREKFTIAKL